MYETHAEVSCAVSKKFKDILAGQTRRVNADKLRLNEEPNAYERAEQEMNGDLWWLLKIYGNGGSAIAAKSEVVFGVKYHIKSISWT